MSTRLPASSIYSTLKPASVRTTTRIQYPYSPAPLAFLAWIPFDATAEELPCGSPTRRLLDVHLIKVPKAVGKMVEEDWAFRMREFDELAGYLNGRRTRQTRA